MILYLIFRRPIQNNDIILNCSNRVHQNTAYGMVGSFARLLPMLPVIVKTGEMQVYIAKESSYPISSNIVTFEGNDDNAKTELNLTT